MCDCLFTSNRKEKVFVIIIYIVVYNIKNYIYTLVWKFMSLQACLYFI